MVLYSTEDFQYDYNLDMTIVIVKYIGKNQHVKIPDKIKGYTVTAIGDKAFAERWNLWEVSIPDSVTTIGEKAFFGCANMHYIKMPINLKEVGNMAFLGCSDLRIVTYNSTKNSWENINFKGVASRPDTVSKTENCLHTLDTIESFLSYASYHKKKE